MRILSENVGLERLRRLKDRLRMDVAVYERHAQSCATCSTPGACCLDEHFVNVRISRLEAVAIAHVVESLPAIGRARVVERMRNIVFQMTETAQGARLTTFACPLYEKGTGCLVHDKAKPVPCIVHACYDRPEDLPPDELQDAAELAVDKVNEHVYRRSLPLEPLPIAVYVAVVSRRRSKNAITSPAKNQPAT